MMEHSMTVAYVEGLARTHNLIAHTDEQKSFLRGGLKEFIEGCKSATKWPCMMLESIELMPTGPDDDSLRNGIDVAIWVAHVTSESNDTYADIERKADECLGVCEDILRRMRYDYQNSAYHDLIHHIDIRQAKMQNVAHLKHGMVGYRMVIPFTHNTSYAIVNDKWSDL